MQSQKHHRHEPVREPSRTDTRAKAPVAAEFEDCFQLFSQLSDAIKVNCPSDKDLSILAEDAMDRLRAWDEESGAAERRLDYVLKSSPMVQGQTKRLLEELHGAVEQAIASIRTQDFAAGGTSEMARVAAHGPPIINTVIPSDAILYDLDAELTTTEWVNEALDIVKCLARLLPAIWDPLEEDDQVLATHAHDRHSTETYKSIASVMFPAASEALLNRLAECNWRRRQYLRRLQERPGQSGLAKPITKGRHFRGRSHRANRATKRKHSNFRQSAVGESDDGSSTATNSERDSIFSMVSYLTAMDEAPTELPNAATVERRPIVSELPGPENAEFECPYCHFELPLKADPSKGMDIDEWQAHVFLDLQPYMCTYGGCNRDNRPFGEIKEWFQHELDFHRSKFVYFCGNDHCRRDFLTDKDFKAHLVRKHETIPSRNLAAVMENCKRHSRDLIADATRCQLCGVVCGNLYQLQYHLAAHLETFALSAMLDLEPADEDEFTEGQKKVHDYIASLPPTRSVPSSTAGDAGADDDDDDDDGRSQGTETTPAAGSRAPGTDVTDASDASMVAVAAQSAGNDHLKAQPDPRPTDKIKTWDFLAPVAAEAVKWTKWSNVPSRYENFVGRTQDLESIHKALSTPGTLCTISGPGGVGKTATAVQYPYTYRFEHVFWVEAENPGTLADKFNAIATCLDPEGKKTPDDAARTWFVRDQLSALDKRWLLIFDNVHAFADIVQYIPRRFTRSKGSILITTRTLPGLEVPQWYPHIPVQLTVWPHDHACEFLLTSLQPNLSKENIRTHREYALAGQVAEKVGRLPLAMSMIVGYLSMSDCELPDFLGLWNEQESRQRHKRRKTTRELSEFNDAIDSLWDIGIQDVAGNSQRLLNILAFLDPETIQRILLVGEHEEDYLAFFHVSSAVSYKRMIKQLKGRRLIQVKVDAATDQPFAYSMHRLLKEKILDEMEKYERGQAFRSAFRLIRKQYPQAESTQVPRVGTWPKCQELMPHVLSFHQVFTANMNQALNDMARVSDPLPVELAQLFYDAGFYVWTRQSTSYDGVTFLQTADRILDGLDKEAHIKLRADIHCMVGLLLLLRSCADQARGTQRLKAARAARVRIFDADPTEENNVLMQNAKADYSLCLMNEHLFDEAGEIWEECYKAYQARGPEKDHPFEYSKYRGQVSIILMWEGRFDEAIKSVRMCLAHTEKFGGKKTQYWRRVYLLGCVLLQASVQDKAYRQAALEAHLDALTGRLETHGKNDQNTIQSMYAVGAMYHHLGDTSTAIEYIKQCIDASRNSKPAKEALARYQFHLAMLYESQGIVDREVEELKRQARIVLEDCRMYAAECVRNVDDEMMIFDDLQGTFNGRYTGVKLLPHLQKHLRDTQPQVKATN